VNGGREKTRAITLLAAVFVAGLTLGWFGHDWSAGARGHGRGRDDDAIVKRLSGELDLTAAQRDSVRAIVGRHHQEIRAIWQEVHPRYDAIRAATRQEIRSQLNPEQLEREERLHQKMESRERQADSTGKGRHERF
jgi:hypothetical protein